MTHTNMMLGAFTNDSTVVKFVDGLVDSVVVGIDLVSIVIVKSILCEKKRTTHDAGNLVPASSLIVATLTHVKLSTFVDGNTALVRGHV